MAAAVVVRLADFLELMRLSGLRMDGLRYRGKRGLREQSPRLAHRKKKAAPPEGTAFSDIRSLRSSEHPLKNVGFTALVFQAVLEGTGHVQDDQHQQGPAHDFVDFMGDAGKGLVFSD